MSGRESQTCFDLVVIGGGPAGYVGAIRAAQLGMTVACVERDRLGGVCLNYGCIPTKALLAGAERYAWLQHDAPAWGIHADNMRFDWSTIIARSRTVVDNLNKGVAALLKRYKIAHVQGHAKVVAGAPQCKVQVTNASEGDNVTSLSCKHVLVSTGAVPRALPTAPFDQQRVISSKTAMLLDERPGALLIVGAGAIGMEFAYLYNAYGTKVTVIEMLERVLPNEDADVSKAVHRAFKKQGIECMVSTKTVDCQLTDTGVRVTVAPTQGIAEPMTLTGDKILVAIGVRGRYDGLIDDSLQLETHKDHIKVDTTNYQTSVDGIYAVGDVIGPPWLAHVASEEAVVCVETIADHRPTPIDYDSIPACTYCMPQIASIGLTEQACIEQGMQKGAGYDVSKFPFIASGKAHATGHTQGFVKLISDAKYGQILGAHMVGESVTEMIAQLALAKRLEATVDQVIATIHPHPTLSEAVHEAALGLDGRMIHA